MQYPGVTVGQGVGENRLRARHRGDDQFGPGDEQHRCGQRHKPQKLMQQTCLAVQHVIDNEQPLGRVLHWKEERVGKKVVIECV